jgi:glycosyltransferase involved in cell wall biosynthesis
MLEFVAQHLQMEPKTWRVAPYGTRHDLFHASYTPREGQDATTLLNVSLYCDQKNLGTLLGAVDRLRSRGDARYRLRLTAGFRAVEAGPWHPNLEAERDMFLRLERQGVVEDVDRQQYRSLPELYRNADVFVFPSYTESFGHPLVEAMATGLPVVAADVPINREMCGDAAVYFPPFDVDACAESIARVAADPDLKQRLGARGLVRARSFTWEHHVSILWDALRSTS